LANEVVRHEAQGGAALTKAEDDLAIADEELWIAQTNADLFSNYRNAYAAANGDLGVTLQYLEGPLSSFLQRVQQGYFLRNASTMLFYMYARKNNLQDPNNGQILNQQDEVMNLAFNGAIPSVYYSYNVPGGKTAKMFMDDAVQTGQLAAHGNTYQVIASQHPFRKERDNKGKEVDRGFKIDELRTYFFQNIASNNYYSIKALTDVVTGLDQRIAITTDPTTLNDLNVARASYQEKLDALNDPQIRAEMLNEHNIISAVSNEWTIRLEPGKVAKRNAKKALDKQNAKKKEAQ